MAEIDRRTFLTGLSAASAFTIVPRRVLGGPGYIAPSDMVLLAQVGCGTQAQRQVNTGLVSRPDVQIVAVVDPNRDTQNYVDWNEGENRESHPALPGGTGVGRGEHGDPRRPRRRQRDHGDLLPEAESPGRHPRLRRLPRDAREGNGHPGRRQHHARSSARQHQHRGAREGQGRHLAQAGRERPLRGPAHGAGRAREQGVLAPAGVQQQRRSPRARRVDQGRRDRYREGSAQLDEPSVLAAGDAGVPRVGPRGSGRIQLGAVAGPGTGSSVSSELHARRVPRLVCVRHRLSRRHGPLQPLAAVPDPGSRRAGVRRSAARTTKRS